MDTTSPKPPPFFKLPAELRDAIYDIVITDNYEEADKGNYLDHWNDVDWGGAWGDTRDDNDNSIGPIRVPRESRSALCQIRSASVNRQWREELFARYHRPRILKLYLDSSVNYFGYSSSTYRGYSRKWCRSTQKWLEILGASRIPLHREIWIGAEDFEYKLKITSDGDVEVQAQPADTNIDYSSSNSMMSRLLWAGAGKLEKRCKVFVQSMLKAQGDGLFSLELVGAFARHVTGNSYSWAPSLGAVGKVKVEDDAYDFLVDFFSSF